MKEKVPTLYQKGCEGWKLGPVPYIILWPVARDHANQHWIVLSTITVI
jgi:hypothetical protein